MKQKTLNTTVSENESKHTPGEWMTRQFGIYNEEKTIAQVNHTSHNIADGEAEANAQRIVTAVNCHDDLLEALIQVMAGLDEGQVDPETKDLAEVAIKKATDNT